MSFVDKVKAQAQQAVQQAQQGLAQGQAKLDSLQAKKEADVLLRDLGAAYYAEQRAGGTEQAVATALAAVDAHAEANGPVDTTPTPRAAWSGATSAPAGPAPTTSAEGAPAPTAPGSPPSTNFSLDDL